METLIAIRDKTIQTTVGNWEKEDRAFYQAAEQAQITEKFESSPGAADVTFETVDDPDQASAEARNLNPGWAWDAATGTGTEPAAVKAEREALEADFLAEADAKADAEIMISDLKAVAAGSYGGNTDQANRVISRAVLFLVLQGIRGNGTK